MSEYDWDSTWNDAMKAGDIDIIIKMMRADANDAAVVNSIIKEMDGVAMATEKVERASKRLQAQRPMRDHAKDVKEVNSAWDMQLHTLDKIFIGLSAIRAIKWATDLIRQGMEYNGMLEQTRMGLGGVIAMAGEVRDANGRLLEGAEKYNASQVIAARMQQHVRSEMYKTTQTVEQLSRAMQEAAAPAFARGFNDDQVARYSIRMAQAARALGINERELGQESRGVLQGDTNPRTSRIAYQIWGNMPDHRKVMKDLEAQGKLFDFIMEKTEHLGTVGEQALNTYSGAMAGTGKALKEALGEASEDIMPVAIRLLTDFREVLTDPGFTHAAKEWAAGIGIIVDAMREGIELGPFKIPGVKDIPDLAKTSASFIQYAQENPGKAFLGGGIFDLQGNFEKWMIQQERNSARINEEAARSRARLGGKVMKDWGFASLLSVMQTRHGWTGDMTYNLQQELGGIAGRDGVDIMGLTSQLYDIANKPKGTKGLYAQMVEAIWGKTGRPGAGPTASGSGGGKPDPPKPDKEMERAIKRVTELTQAEEVLAKRTSAVTASFHEQSAVMEAYDKYVDDVAKSMAHTEDKIRRVDDALIKLGANPGEDAIFQLGELSAAADPKVRRLAAALEAVQKQAGKEAWAKYNRALVKAFDEAEEARLRAQIDMVEYGGGTVMNGPLSYTLDRSDDARRRDAETLDMMRRNAGYMNRDALLDQQAREMEFVTQPFFSALEAWSASGGKDFGQYAAQTFQANMARDLVAGSQQLFQAWADLIAPVVSSVDAEGNVYWQPIGAQGHSDPRYTSPGKAQMTDPRVRRAAYGAAFANIAIGSYANAAAGGEHSMTQGLVGGAVSGFATTGEVWGAVVGAIVGWASAYFGKQKAEGQEQGGKFTFDAAGNAYLIGGKNLTPDQQKRIQASVQDTVDGLWNSYIGVILEFHRSDLIPKMKDIFRLIDGDFLGKPTSKNFLSHLDAWQNGELSDQMVQGFRPILETLFTSVGFTVERFAQIHQRLNNLDPQKQAELYGSLATSSTTMQELMAYWNPMAMEPMLTPWQRQMMDAESRQRWMPHQILEQTEDPILRLGEALGSLTGEGQIRAAQMLAQLSQDRFELEKRMAEQMVQLLTGGLRSFDAQLRELELMGMVQADGTTPDYASQLTYLRDYANSAYQNMQRARNADELEYWRNEFQGTISQIVSIAGNLDPATFKEWQEWAAGALKEGRAAFETAVREWGDAIQEQSTAFFNRLKPIWDEFLGIIETATDPLNEFTGVLPGVGPQFRDLNTAIGGTITKLNEFGAALTNNVPPPGSGGGGGEPVTPISPPGVVVRGYSSRVAARRFS